MTDSKNQDRKPKPEPVPDNFKPVGEAAKRVLEDVSKLLGKTNGRPTK